MKNLRSKIIISVPIILLLSLSLTTYAEITIEPFGFAISIEENDETNVELVLRNSGEDDVGFSISDYIIEDENDRQAGPRRDDLGDRIATFEAGGGWWTGLAWDGERMWGVNHDSRNMIAIDMDGEVEDIAQLNFSNPMGMCWDGEAFWVCSSSTELIYRIDTNGEILRSFNPEGTRPTGIAWDGENLWFCDYRGGTTFIYQIDTDGETILTLDLRNIERSWLSCAWMPEHEDGQLWVLHNHGTLYQLRVEDDQTEIIQQTNLNLDNNFGLEHDGENLWYPSANRGNDWYVIDDGIVEFCMITVDPDNGVIQADDYEAVDILIQSEGCEAGIYNILLEIELYDPEDDRDDPNQVLIELSVVITVDDPTFNLSGVVTDAATDETVENVTIEMDRYIITRYSNDEGEYNFDNLPPGNYEITYTAHDYLPTTEIIEIEEDDVELNVALLHSDCTPSNDDFIIELEPDMDHTFRFAVFNRGNGPLTYRIERHLIGGANAESWELRSVQNVEEIVEDNQINGVVYADDCFFVSGGNNRDNVSKIYVFNSDGEFESEFDQFHESSYGMRDLCWDGELIWGADDDILYGFNTEGELVSEIVGDASSYRSLTYDTDNDLFISAHITSGIFISDRDGELVRTIDSPDGLRIYGIAYWYNDPDGYNLYVFSRGDETDLMVNKMNLENGDLTVVTEIDMDNGRPGGICITNQLDIYSWVFIGIVQNPDRVAIWQLATYRDWFRIEPEAGEIEAEGREDFVLTLDATGLLPDNTFEGILVFHHNG
ncbi:MAG: carboxypeptidase regulatory-like domain-containing protein, partial [Candidatus Hatepunaea meridiana]|nr:carboxypeptidase regulatory-like domain-containing protein [Candidatus Hatepunaea meridiana]